VVVAGVLVPIVLWTACILAALLQFDGLAIPAILGVLATPAAFAWIASRRWTNPMRRSIRVKFFVATTILNVVISGCALLVIGLLHR
jgi:hypothetical protein